MNVATPAVYVEPAGGELEDDDVEQLIEAGVLRMYVNLSTGETVFGPGR